MVVVREKEGTVWYLFNPALEPELRAERLGLELFAAERLIAPPNTAPSAVGGVEEAAAEFGERGCEVVISCGDPSLG